MHLCVFYVRVRVTTSMYFVLCLPLLLTRINKKKKAIDHCVLFFMVQVTQDVQRRPMGSP